MNTRRILMVVAMLMLTLSFSAFTTVGSGPAVSGTPVPGTGSRIYLPLALNSGNGDNWKQYANE
ncbi:hypothetical protein CO015_05305, partial [candidate division WWE3 bacterium CG_4_8_14_3_um_filter_42_11]